MRFSLDLSHHPWTRAADPAATASQTLALAQSADAAGIDAIWVTEDPDGWDAFALLGALATVTRHVQLGTGVTNPYLRSPNLLAASLATLDRLSAGRAILGLGRGQPEWYARSLGMDVGAPLAALAETIDLLRQWWSPPHRASSPTDSSHFHVRDWERAIHPLQPHPPIYLAAAGPQALALAGRLADGVIFNTLTSDTYLADAIPAVRSAAAAAARDPSALAFVLRTPVVVTADPEPVLERQKNLIALVNALPGMDRLLQTPGFDLPAIMTAVRRHMRTGEILASGGAFADLRRAGDLPAARAAIPTDLVAQLAIADQLPHVRARLHALAALGITHVSVTPPPPPAPSEALATLLHDLRSP